MNSDIIKWVYVLVLKHKFKLSDLAIIKAEDLNLPYGLSRREWLANDGDGFFAVLPEYVADDNSIIKRVPFTKFLDVWYGRGNTKIAPNEPWR